MVVPSMQTGAPGPSMVTGQTVFSQSSLHFTYLNTGADSLLRQGLRKLNSKMVEFIKSKFSQEEADLFAFVGLAPKGDQLLNHLKC